MKTFLKYATYPAIFAANFAIWGIAIAQEWALEATFFYTFLGSLVVLGILELAIPHKREWSPSGREWLRDLVYFGINGGVDAGAKALTAVLAIYLATGSNGLPLWIDIPLAILVADFAGYWLHRAGHSGWLWKVHGVHHVPDKVNLVNNNTAHFLNILLSALASSVPLLLIGSSPEAVLVATGFVSLQSFAVHANIEIELGPFNHVFMSPVHHRLHHSTKLSEAGNFASAITLWDKLFGTFVYAPGLEPEEVGVVEPETFPAPTNIVANAAHPFVPGCAVGDAHSS